MKPIKGEYFTYPTEAGDRKGFVSEDGKVYTMAFSGDTFPPTLYPLPVEMRKMRSGWSAQIPAWDIYAAASSAGDTASAALAALYWRTPVRCQHPGCEVRLPREKMTDAGHCPKCAEQRKTA